jgi:WD40 repeat protein
MGGKYIEIAGGKITETYKYDYNLYAGRNIILNAGKSVILHGEEGITFGEPLHPPQDEHNGSDKSTEIEESDDSTVVIIYSAGYLNILNEGGGHDQGNNFKKNALALEMMRKSEPGCDPNQIILAEARSTKQFINVTNKTYESGKIISLTVFSHGTESSISLGGEMGNDEQLHDYDQREINFKTIDQIDKNNFAKTAEITLYGCNIGTDGESSFAQEIANILSVTVKAFDGPAEAKSKNRDGRPPLVFDGTMIKTADRKTQKVQLLTFKPKT